MVQGNIKQKEEVQISELTEKEGIGMVKEVSDESVVIDEEIKNYYGQKI